MIKVLLADDLEIVRSLMRYVLEKKGGMEVLVLASNGQEAVHEAITPCSERVVLDVSMPTMDGLEAAKQISGKCPNARVLMVSMHRTSYHLQLSMEAGASGYVLKDALATSWLQPCVLFTRETGISVNRLLSWYSFILSKLVIWIRCEVVRKSKRKSDIA